MKQLRKNFDPIRKGLSKGETYLLMYRSKPLGVIRPYSSQTDAQFLGAGEDLPALGAPTPPAALPDPKMISFSSTFDSGELGSAAQSAQPIESIRAIQSPAPARNPLNRLGMRRAFL